MLKQMYEWGNTIYETFTDIWEALINKASALLPQGIYEGLPNIVQNILDFRLIELIIGGTIGTVIIIGIAKFFVDIIF